ncbi:hypothetical protein M409DRAFT_60898 [Zasmidium cellare ATCC 36951]|uniref:Amidase domain-containing protein n=1 Tax=Zasmidium cellare ATCC 36951 TaxID=1080233 RepID=A0A6A6C0H2_ZASCE|nr:uncharacterized protein M409DRAFT_60898 [Zasmidium cellare ATCC 36951]KAF2159312.1 hypothetical protein M409DRAFT_60898 [Zasmidium cellare ATCC 36951]
MGSQRKTNGLSHTAVPGQLCDLTASQARLLIGQGVISPVEILESCIARVEASNPSINAVVTKAYERARLEAVRAAQDVADGRPLGILHGLPILIKDLNETENIRTTYCSPLYEDHIPNADDTVVARLRQHGAIVFGKTNSPEFGIGSNTTNRVFGPTRNPFATDLTVGGSSGGAAAALSTHMAPIVNGSDSGASIRNPAAFCGIVGLRPTPGLVSSPERKVGMSTNGVEGPMARTVADVALLLAAMAKHDPRDMMSVPVEPKQFLTLKSVDASSLRVGFSEDLGFAPVDKIVRETFRRKLEIISPSLAVCEECDVQMTDAEEAYWGVRGLYLLAGHHARYKQHGQALDANLVWNIEDALHSTPLQYAEAFSAQTRIYRDFQSVFDKYDVLITPAVNVLPFPHAQSYPTTLEGRPARHYAEWYSITYAVSLVGHPAISLSAGLDPHGTPFGLQVIGTRFNDRRLLEVAQALELVLSSHAETRRPEPDVAALSS